MSDMAGQHASAHDLAVWLLAQATADHAWWSGSAEEYTEGSGGYIRARDEAAGAEAKLAILDEHPPVPLSETHDGCKTCVTWHDDEGVHEFGIAVSEPWPCRTVRLLGAGYKHRPGYREEWAP